ncbi:MAG: glycosyltransferase family 2 protein, partial [Bacteroidaceae bacterium]
MSKISIIIPVHNTAIYLHKCVESVRNQSLKDIEIILVDNLSTDGSSELCDEYALIDSRIKVLHLSIAGPSVARNAGINIATSQYIGFVDSDDYVEPNMYQDMLSALLENQAEMVYCNFCYEYEDKYTENSFTNS